MQETGRPPKRRKMSLRLILLAIVVVAAAVLVDWRELEPLSKALRAYLAPKPAAEAASPKALPAVPVSVARVQRGAFPIVLTGLGNVQPYNTVLVRSRVDGQIVKIHFTEGQLVHAGDLLVEIDPRPFKAALDQANAKKQQDQANLDNAQRDLLRYQSLAKSDFATRQQLDTQSATVAQLTAQIAADAATIETAQVQLDYATIRAPITGRTGFRLVDEGNIVNAANAGGIVSIAQIEPIAVVFTAPEDDLPQITAGLQAHPLDVRSFSSDGTTLLADGRLELFNNEIDSGTGTIRLKAAFDNKEHKLWPGLSVSTKLTVAVHEGALLIPAVAVQHSQQGLYAFVIGTDDKAHQRPIKVTQSDDRTAVVDDGLKEGETVVVGGQYRLQDGTVVKSIGQGGAETAQGAKQES